VHSNRYTLLYALGLTVAVAVALALVATGLASRQEANAAFARRIAILETVMDVDAGTVEADYARYIRERVFDFQGNELSEVAAFDLEIAREARKPAGDRLYPLYEFERDGSSRVIVPLRGAGLWGPISAYLALEADLSTIAGVSFDHEKETPGLGAEINTAAFEGRFTGKRLFDGDGAFTSVRVVKAGLSESSPHEVDGLTGATMTMNGVTDMLEEELALYREIFREIGS
jgi:Na+-transporting NADH:ubiquinone oxidoreductase subunit C